MGFGSVWHWVIVLLVVIMVFGTAKLKNIGKDLGGAIKDFKKGLKDDEVESAGKSKDQETIDVNKVVNPEAVREKSGV